MDECCGVAFPLLGKDVAFDLSFFISHCCYSRNFSFFSLVRCICFPSAALLYLSILIFVFTLDLFFFFYLSTYTMMMMTTNRRQCTIYSRRYPPILLPFLLTSSYPYIHTYSHDHCRLSSSYSSSPLIVQLVVVHTLRRLFFSFVPCSLL